MMMLVRAGFLFIIYIITYYLYGFAVAKLCKAQHISMINAIIMGFWTEGLQFFIFVLPFKVALVEVSTVAWIWPVVWLVSIGTIVLIWHRDIGRNIADSCRRISACKLSAIVVGMVIGAELIYELLYGNYTDGNGAAYFVGAAASDIFKNHFGVVEPEIGTMVSSFNTMYFLQTYVHHTAVVCKISGIAPLVEMRGVMSEVVILLSGLITYELARAIFKNKRKKVLFFWLAYQAFILLCAQSVYIPAYYLFYRAFEGKTIFGMLLIPYVFVCFWKLYDNERDIHTLICLVIALFGSFTFCMSTMYILPFLLLAFIPVAVVQKSFRQAVNWCIMMVPSALSILYYIMVMKGIIDLTIRW
jgi:hypothetical protein